MICESGWAHATRFFFFFATTPYFKLNFYLFLLVSDVRIPRQFNCEVLDTRSVLNGVRPRFLTSKASVEIGSALVVDHSYSKKTAVVLAT
jgi:hypothetical protein